MEGVVNGGLTTAATDVGNPFDADPVAQLDTRMLSSWTHLDDVTNTFMAANLSGFRWWQVCPKTHHGAIIRVTHSRMCPENNVSKNGVCHGPDVTFWLLTV